MSISWYIQRIKTFSAKEIVYRVKQRARTHVLDKKIYDRQATAEIALPKSSIISDDSAHFMYPIFEKAIDIFKPIDWHLDVQSQKSFPKKFAHKINIRSDEYGSAKHVWEVNRLLFLTHIAKLYSEKKEAKYLELFMFHLTSWKNANPYLTGVNWYSNIEVNLRLINWYYCWNLLKIDELRKANNTVEQFVNEVWQPLIHEHAEFSHRHPSLYSSANNHLISEYAGLFVAAAGFDIPQKKARLKYALKGLEKEILLQNSSEGINREEAAEYIQFIDDFFLIAASVARQHKVKFSTSYNERLHSMARYLNTFMDVNYNYPMYGDGDDGFVLRPDAGGHFNNFKSLLAAFASYFEDPALKRSDLEWDEKCSLILGEKGQQIFEALPCAGDLASVNSFYKDQGHFIFRKKFKDDARKETYLHFDAAPLGFLSIAAHGHADALSFMLHVDGQPIFADVGTFTYHTHKELRKYFVSTLAHNTICINGKNQASLAGPTMWLNHYQSKVLSANENSITATHNGYSKEGVTHVREIRYDRNADEFTIIDTLAGNKYSAEIPFHLHPSVSVELSGNTATLTHPTTRSVQVTLDKSLTYRIVRGEDTLKTMGWYSEHFGERNPTNVLYAKMECNGTVRFETKIKVSA